MQFKQFRVLSIVMLFLLSSLLLGYLLWVRLQLSLVRYFDADELAYLHWAHNVFSGVLPYRDFLLYVPPGFLYVLAPIYIYFQGATPLIASRVIAFCIFVSLAGVASLLFWRVRHSWVAVWVAIFLVFLPLPADKFLEVRPDTLAMVIGLIGLLCQIGWVEGNKKLAFWSGLAYAISLLVLPKTVPQIGIAIGVALFQRYRWRFFCGLGIPLALFGLWAFFLGNFSDVWYSLSRLPFEVNRIGQVYPILQWHFFYPNATYYGASGWNIGLLVNHAMWLIGGLIGAVRLVTPYIPNGKRGAWAEVLIAGSFIAHSIAFMYGYPMRHAQYLIPIAVFVSFYAADAISIVWSYLLKRRGGSIVCALSCIALVFGIRNISNQVNAPKFLSTNREDIAILERALATIPKHAYVFDLVGSTIYFRDPYYVCCVPFGQWEPYLSRPLPRLPDALKKTNTKYIYQGKLERIKSLSITDQEYIASHFTQKPGFGTILLDEKN